MTDGSWKNDGTKLPELPEGYQWSVIVHPEGTVIQIRDDSYPFYGALFESQYRADSYAADERGWKRGVVHRAYGLLAQLETYLRAATWGLDFP